MLYEVPPLSYEPASPRLTYIRTLLGCLEMLKLGITAVHDDAYYIPYPTPETIDALMQAYADSGMRAIATIDQPNVVEYDKYPYLKDLLPPDVQQEMANAPSVCSFNRSSSYIRIDDILVHYVEKGDRQKPLMVFLHGFPEFWYSWRYQIENFADDFWFDQTL